MLAFFKNGNLKIDEVILKSDLCHFLRDSKNSGVMNLHQTANGFALPANAGLGGRKNHQTLHPPLGLP
jgi:hypothetical protein